jgi:hypothetical protein
MQCRLVIGIFFKINFSYFQATAKTMAKMNKVMNPAHMSKVTQQFTQEHTKLGIKGEMSM